MKTKKIMGSAFLTLALAVTLLAFGAIASPATYAANIPTISSVALSVDTAKVAAAQVVGKEIPADTENPGNKNPSAMTISTSTPGCYVLIEGWWVKEPGKDWTNTHAGNEWNTEITDHTFVAGNQYAFACTVASTDGYILSDKASLSATANGKAAEVQSVGFDGTNSDAVIFIDLGTFNGTFTPVTDITGVPSSMTAGSPLSLTGTVAPSNATNKSIVWSIKDAGQTGAALSGNTLTAKKAGKVVVTATIANGTAQGTAYTKDFTITVNAGTTTYGGPATGDASDIAFWTGMGMIALIGMIVMNAARRRVDKA